MDSTPGPGVFSDSKFKTQNDMMRIRVNRRQSTAPPPTVIKLVVFIPLLVLIVIILNSSIADSFVLSHSPPYSRKKHVEYKASIKSQETVVTGSWSLSASNEREGSRFGLRKRVKAVLRNAKNRTGLANINSEEDLIGEEEPIAISQGIKMSDAFDDDYDGLLLDNDYGDFPVISVSAESKTAGSTLKSLGKSLAETSSKPPSTTLNKKNTSPLPFTLPPLTAEQTDLLQKGERVQYQAKMGREGNGYVVMDVRAPDYVVWECLLDFESYPENIGTVKSMRMFTSTHLNSSYIAEDPVLPGTGRSTRHYGRASVTRASFVLSKFKLNIAAVHKYRPHPDGHYMTFSLDKACKNVVLQDAKGIWFTQPCPDGRQDYTRVWLLCELKVSPILPTFIVDYAARRAMPRATTWLKPVVETAANRWLTGM
jgi:hypothetical protein